MEFPRGFLFGSAVSPYQVEGNTGDRKTDWDDYLQRHPEKNLSHPDGINPNWWVKGVAEEDFTTLRNLGLNAQRLGFEWARIMPEEGKIDLGSIKRYREMVDSLKGLGMEPMITLNHFTLPVWAAGKGGWENPKISQDFKKYTEVVVNAFGDVSKWVSLNEPSQIIDMGYIFGSWPPGKKFRVDQVFQVEQNLRKAHYYAFELLKKHIPNAQVGVANAVKFLTPHNPNSFLDRKITGIANYLGNNKLIDSSLDFVDFIGVNYYHSYLLKFKPTIKVTLRDDAEGVIKTAPFLETVKPEGFVSDTGWSITPVFFHDLLMDLHKRYRKPIIITENGIADKEGKMQAFYILTHLIAIEGAISQGVKINGYYYWASIDTQEWMLGNKYKFGLISLDQKSKARTLRDGAYLLGAIAKSGQINTSILSEKYLTPKQQLQLNTVVKYIYG